MDDPLLQYAEANSTPETNVLKSLRIKTWQTVLSPQMLSDSVQGSFLSNISRMIRPRRILELGTYSGYSTICLSAGLQIEGTIDTIEPNDELHSIQERTLEKSRNLRSSASPYLRGLNSTSQPQWTLRFGLDRRRQIADTSVCRIVFEPQPELEDGSLVDNVLWWGKVLPDHPAPDETALALRKMTEDLASRKSIRTTLMPMRDGLLMIEKLSD